MMKPPTFLSVLAAAARPSATRTFALFLLLASLHYCFGQTDTNLIATGDWSEAVNDGDGHLLRGRLLVYDNSGPTANNRARVYLELQHLYSGPWFDPIQVYCEFGWSLKIEMNDQFNQPINHAPGLPYAYTGPPPIPYWVTLPPDSTIRLRADYFFMSQPSKPTGLEISGPGGRWIVPPEATNDFYLSATFRPLKEYHGAQNKPTLLKDYIWQGTLKLPKVRIPATKQ